MATYKELLHELKERAKNSSEQGDLFEKAMCAYFRQSPEYNFNVWQWGDWPERGRITGLNAQDTGIDLVATDEDGSVYAIQCKFYDSGTTIQKSHIDSFFTASGHEAFDKRIIVATSDKWSKHAENALKDQSKPISRIGFSDLAEESIDWDLINPLNSKWAEAAKELYPHQKEALQLTLEKFTEHDRGKLIMACGSGKTLTALHIAEQQAPKAGRVLFLVPSISLLSQSLREWAHNRTRPHTYLAVCSDDKADKDSEDIRVHDMARPPTTNPADIRRVLARDSERLRIVFCTYQSLERIHQAQRGGGFPDFDLVICDEAHRTTGVETHGRGDKDKVSAFSRIHKADYVRAEKRLYMTATPRLYTGPAKVKAAEENVNLYSMDDEAQYGPEFYRLDFSEAIELDLLADYRVIILAIHQGFVNRQLTYDVFSGEEKFGLPDAAKIVGCYKALRDQGWKPEDGGQAPAPLRRAVSFATKIETSETITRKFAEVIKAMPESDVTKFVCEGEHVDGSHSMLVRNERLKWLKEEVEDEESGALVCRILSNAKCLTEGVDVPALDAIMFMNPRKSQVDVVQAVGRVMRKAEGKKYGYVILPVTIPDGQTPEEALDDDKAYETVWQVLRALRSHDNRFNAEINKIDLNENKPKSIIIDVIGPVGEGGESGEGEPGGSGDEKIQAELDLGDVQLYTEAIYAKLVEKCGDRVYWEKWANDLASINKILEGRIRDLIAANKDMAGLFAEYLDALHATINPGITQEQAVGLLSQHLITRPVFDALFSDYAFSDHNPVAQGLNAVLDKLDEHGLSAELRDMEGFYESVRKRAAGIDNPKGRQKILVELYEKFFRTALRKQSESLGIAYTPIEVVDFLLHSADYVVNAEFGAEGLGDKGVSIIDPFTGTGSFVARLIQGKHSSGGWLIPDKDLPRKFNEETFANDILLLSYYLAAVNIESVAHDRMGGEYRPFPGVVWTDTFQLGEQSGGLLAPLSPENDERIKRQKAAKIQVVVGNPPWSVGKKSENDAGNLKYPELDQKIRDTYVAESSATNVNALYDSYIRALRWASDRIGDQGVIAFVTNGGFIDGTAADGIRKTLTAEFDKIWCVNLRGNARLQGEARRYEKGNIFGGSTKASVGLLILVKTPSKEDGAGKAPAVIRYADIGGYLSTHEKLDKLQQAGSINGAGLDWETIPPDENGDWINQRDPAFDKFILLGDKDNKGKESGQAVFLNFSSGVKTNRDAWALNFSKDKLSRNMGDMVTFYNEERTRFAKAKAADPKADVQKFIDRDEKKISWSGNLIDGAAKNKQAEFDSGCIRTCLYRPFTKQHLYFSRQFNERVYQVPKLFPAPDSESRVICIVGTGTGKSFSAIMTDIVPEHLMMANGKCFPRYVYDETGARHDAVRVGMLKRFKEEYKDKNITADAVFDYVYGLLHSPEYRERFAANLSKEMPRIPFVPGAGRFHQFAEAGAKLAEMHLNYETVAPYRLNLAENGKEVFEEMLEAGHFRVKKMKLVKTDPTRVVYNDRLTITGIPPEAWDYHVNGAPVLQHIMDRYLVKTDKISGLKNDANDWAPDDPRYILNLFRRVVTVSLETQKIVDGLPELGV